MNNSELILWNEIFPAIALWASMLTVELFCVFVIIKGIFKLTIPRRFYQNLPFLFPVWLGLLMAMSRTVAGSYFILYSSLVLWMGIFTFISSSKCRKLLIEH